MLLQVINHCILILYFLINCHNTKTTSVMSKILGQLYLTNSRQMPVPPKVFFFFFFPQQWVICGNSMNIIYLNSFKVLCHLLCEGQWQVTGGHTFGLIDLCCRLALCSRVPKDSVIKALIKLKILIPACIN